MSEHGPHVLALSLSGKISELKPEQKKQFVWLAEKIVNTMIEGFYGEVAIKMEKGAIQQVYTIKSEIPPK